MRCVVFGATGYLGSRLVPELLTANHEVRVMGRTTAKLDDVPWRARVEVVEGDVTDPKQVRQALWVNLVTPLPRVLAVSLTESLKNDGVCADHDIARGETFPVGAAPLRRAFRGGIARDIARGFARLTDAAAAEMSAVGVTERAVHSDA